MKDNFEARITDEAQDKLNELLKCGNERVELAAAKEIMTMYGKQSESDDKEVRLEVNIVIKEPIEERGDADEKDKP